VGIPTAGRRGTLIERFEAKVVRVPESGCWIWTGCLSKSGYGKFGVGLSVRPAHRVSYEIHVGQIPIGLHIDHLCRVTQCVNPYHLEPVTCAENVRRGTAREATKAYRASITSCPAGHGYTVENTGFSNLLGGKYKARYCKQCKREMAIARYQEHRDEINAKRSRGARAAA
jgi:hypothetical protein